MFGAIAVQAFNKAKHIIRTLESIAACRGSKKYNLFILQDGCAGSEATEKYREAWIETTRAIKSWASNNSDHFRSFGFRGTEQNNGPYKTAERLIDWALETNQSVIFSEDDVLFEEDAIEWFERALAHPVFLRPDVWASAGESKFFDAKRQVPSSAEVNRALQVARDQRLIDRFSCEPLIPSSCFATTREKWTEFGKTRGSARGDRALVERCRAERKLCMWPVIARCRDTGMHDPLGYSVRWRGGNHPVVKNTYIVSGMLQDRSGDLIELVSGKGELFYESTKSWDR
jgi:hypothetical protein